jgi:hypothetical protein
MTVLKQFNKFRQFNLRKWNIGHDNVVDQQVDPFLIIEILLINT